MLRAPHRSYFHACLPDRPDEADTITVQHEFNRAKLGSAGRLSRWIYKPTLVQNSGHQLALLHLTMSSQQTTPSYHFIPSSVARTLARSGVELTPELALEISKAMVEGSGGASTIDNTATAGGTTLAKVAGDNRQAGASEQAVGLDPVRRKEGELKSVEREKIGRAHV